MDHPVHRKSPFTQQSRGCGLPGDFITIPYQFFTNWNQTLEVYGDPAKVFVHEWAKFRYGIFDEFGFSGDDLYPNYYKVDGQMVPTGSSDLLIKGAWLKQGVPCDPSEGQEGPQVCKATKYLLMFLIFFLRFLVPARIKNTATVKLVNSIAYLIEFKPDSHFQIKT